MRRYTAPRGCLVERKHGICRATRFERANLLKILALKEKRGAARFIQARACQHKRAMDIRPNPLVG
jgi:hypothetical protein